MRHIYLKECADCDSIQAKEVDFCHIPKDINPSNISTKEMRNAPLLPHTARLLCDVSREVSHLFDVLLRVDVSILGLRNQHDSTSRVTNSLYRYQRGLSNHITPGC